MQRGIGGGCPVLVVCDEAHWIIPLARDLSSASASIDGLVASGAFAARLADYVLKVPAARRDEASAALQPLLALDPKRGNKFTFGARGGRLGGRGGAPYPHVKAAAPTRLQACPTPLRAATTLSLRRPQACGSLR